jgi:hypothetical protein
LLFVHCPVSVLGVMSAGQVIVGCSVSLTVTVKEQLLVLPATSVAVQVTKFVPRLKVDPEAGRQFVVTPGQLSVTAVTEKVTVAAHCPATAR